VAWNDSDEIRVASGGQIYIAPVGTTLPTTPTGSLAAAFVGLGYCSEDGVKLSVTPEIGEIKSWQSRQATRRDLTAQEVMAGFELQQWNEDTVPFAFGGGAVTQLGGAAGYRYDLPLEGDALAEKAMVIEWVDGSITQRWVIPRGNVVDGVETQGKRGEASLLPIGFKGLEPTTGGSTLYWLTSDSTSFAAGS
jgi:hypothetical protein